MLVNDLVNVATDNLREKYLKENLKVKEYIPISEKITKAKSIVRFGMHDKDGEYRADSPSTYILYTLVKLDTWTNLDIDFAGDTMGVDEQYDALDKLGLIEKIFAMLPEKDISEFDVIYTMVLNDVKENELSTKYVVEKTIAKFGTAFGEFVTPLLDQVLAQLPSEEKTEPDIEVVK